MVLKVLEDSFVVLQDMCHEDVGTRREKVKAFDEPIELLKETIKIWKNDITRPPCRGPISFDAGLGILYFHSY